MKYFTLLMLLTSFVAHADDANFIRKASKDYQLPAVIDSLRNSPNDVGAMIYSAKRCSALFGALEWSLEHLENAPEDDQQVIQMNAMYSDLRIFAIKVDVASVKQLELSQETFNSSLVEHDPDIYEFTTQYFGLIHRNHDSTGTLIQQNAVLQAEVPLCMGMYEQLSAYF